MLEKQIHESNVNINKSFLYHSLRIVRRMIFFDCNERFAPSYTVIYIITVFISVFICMVTLIQTIISLISQKCKKES